jgi:hypothetical protein
VSEELDLGTRADGRPFRVPVSTFDYHAQVVGPTGYGKTYFLMRLFQELVEKTDSCVVFIDPAGDAYHFLKRWCYEQSLDSRLVLVDPGEHRMVCGYNPVRPWPQNRGLQAARALDNVRRALGTEGFSAAPLAAQWMFNLLYALIESGLTFYEAPDLLDYKPSALRGSIIEKLHDPDTRRDWVWLQEMIGAGNPQMLRLAYEQLGSSYRRVRQYVRNDNLRLMLATVERALSWKDILDQRKIVLVNLQRRQVLADEDQRMLGIQIVSELIEETFRREADSQAESRVPCYLIADEFSRFAAQQIAQVLTEGRKYLLRLILAHQTLAQLIDIQKQDSTLYHAVLSCARTKVVFGGLSPMDADELGRTLYGHRLDPERRKLELWSWMQLSHVQPVEITSEGWSSGSSSGKGEAAGYSYPGTPGYSPPSYNSTTSSALQQMDNYQHSVTRSLMVLPGDPQQQLSSVQFENLEEQLYRHVSRMVGRPEREAVMAISKDDPVDFRVAHVENPKIGTIQANEIDIDLMRTLPFYSPPSVIEEEIRSRHAALLSPPPSATWERVADGISVEDLSPGVPKAQVPARKPQGRRSRSSPTGKTRQGPKAP